MNANHTHPIKKDKFYTKISLQKDNYCQIDIF